MESRRAFCRTAALTAGAVLLTRTTPAAAATPPQATVISEKRFGANVMELIVFSSAMRRFLKVRLLLPDGWEETDRTWPTVWALHGGNEDFTGWSTHTDIASLTATSPVIVVMPEGGKAGGYVDWWNYGRGDSYNWETFHLTELRTLLEQKYKANKNRAVLGQSTGGYGALIYAARNPGMFKFAAAYSPFASILAHGAPEVLLTGLAGLGSGTDKWSMWGHPILNRGVWEAHDPLTQAARLRGTELYVSCARKPIDPAEMFCLYTTQPFLDRLKELNIPVHTNLYDPGLHTWPYWEKELHRSWPMITKAIA